jgi:hypothetical protein
LPAYEKRWIKGPEPVAQYSPNPFGLFDMCETCTNGAVIGMPPNIIRLPLNEIPEAPSKATGVLHEEDLGDTTLK